MRAAMLTLALALGQAPASSPASLQGRVVESGTGNPVAHARIVAAKVGGPLADYRTLTADETGRFAFRDLVPGTYRLFAQRDGFPQAEYGRKPVSATGIPISLQAGQTVSDIAIAMTPPGVITGHVFDRGQPVRNVFVRALRATYTDGERSFSTAEWTQSDDDGEYRLFSLSPGLYFVSATPPPRPRIEGDAIVTPVMPANANNNQRSIRATLTDDGINTSAFEKDVTVPVYYPGTADAAAATPIGVRAATVTPAVDLTVMRASAYNIRGRGVIVGAAAPPQQTMTVSVNQRDVRLPLISRSVPIKDNAFEFEMSDVPPGAYYVLANLRSTVNSTLSGGVPVIVIDRDVDEVNLTLQPAMELNGRATFEGRTSDTPLVGAQAILVQLRGLDGFSLTSAWAVRADGTFTIPDARPGDYRLRALRAPWVKSARFGTEDVLDTPIHVQRELQDRPLDIVISFNTATLNAVVLDANQRPVSGVLVVAVPDLAHRIRSDLYRSATTDGSGRVRLEGIAPGEYKVFASGDIDAASWQDPDIIRIYESRGETIRFVEGGTPSATLRLIP